MTPTEQPDDVYDDEHDIPDEAWPGNIPPAAHEDYEPPPKKRWPLVVVALLLLAGGVAALPLLISSSWLNNEIRGWLRDNLETPADFQTLDVSWSEGVRLTGLQVFETSAAKNPVLYVRLVELDVAFLPLLTRSLDVKKLVLTDPVVRIAQNEDGSLRSKDVVKTEKVKQSRDGKDEEAMVLPRINVPVEVRNLTFVFVDKEGREVERPGIEFTGHLSTRDGPSTFRLRVPDGAGQLALDGEATLFDPDGALLSADRFEIRSKLRLEDLDADSNRDLIALFMGDSPASGHLDGTVDVTTRGGDAEGSLDVRLRGVAVGSAVGARDPNTEDLRMTAKFSWKNERLVLRDTALHGEGIDAQAQVEGPLDALDGQATFQADLAKSAAALRSLGVDLPSGIEGLVDGRLTFTPKPAGATGSMTLTGLRLPPAVPGGGDLLIARAEGALRASLSGEQIDIAQFEIRIPDGNLASSGWVRTDGTLEIRTVAAGDVGALIARARDLGLAPRDIALAGSLDANLVARRGVGEPGVGLTIETLALRGDGVTIDASGTVGADGRLNLSASGDGSLEKLLAAGGTTSAGGVDLSSVRGRFSFAGSVEGRPDAPLAVLERLTIDGSLKVDAAGTLRPSGEIEARLAVDGSINDAVQLGRGLGLIEGDVVLDGRIDMRAIVGGTRDAPTVPEASVRLTDGPVLLDVEGALTDTGRLSATATADIQLDPLLRIAATQGWIDHAPTSGGRLTARAVIGGTRDLPEIVNVTANLTGPLTASAEASLPATPRNVRARIDFRGALQPLANFAAELRGEAAQELAGDLEGALSVEGALDAPTISLQRLAIRTAGLTATAQGTYHPDRTGNANVNIDGPFDGLIDLVHAAGLAGHLGGTGQVNVSIEARMTGAGETQAATGSLTASLRDLALVNAAHPGAMLRESDLRIAVPSARFEIASGRTSGPTQATLSTSAGLRVALQADAGMGGDVIGADIGVTGPVQPLLDAAAFFTGGVASPVAGTIDAAARIDGKMAAPDAQLRRLKFQSDSLVVDVDGRGTGLGNESMSASGNATIRGAIAPLLAMLQSAGVAADVRAEGTLDASVRLDSFERGVATAIVEARATDLAVSEPPVGSGRFREPELRVAKTTIVVETKTGHVRPFPADVRMKGFETTARVEVTPGTGVPGSGTPSTPEPAPLLVVVEAGRLDLREEFVRNHPEFFPDVTLQGAKGTYAFRGDVSRGLDGAGGWTGSLDLTATGFVAPHVNVTAATLKSVLAGGQFRIDPLDAQVNGGTAKATAVLGLVGEKPEHQAEVHAQGIAIQGDMASLLSRVSPVLAVGDAGRAGGTTGLDATFTAKGLDAEILKRSLNGQGTLTMKDVFAESGNWIGKLLDLVGDGGGRLSVTNASVPFEVRRGQVTTQEVGMGGGSLDMLLGGKVGLDGSLDYAFKVRPKKRGGTFDKYATLLDPNGYLPLRLAGDISSPDLKLPSLGDAVKSGLGGLLDDLKDKFKDKLDGKKDDAEQPKDQADDPVADDEEEVDDGVDENGEPKKKRRKRRKKDG